MNTEWRSPQLRPERCTPEILDRVCAIGRANPDGVVHALYRDGGVLPELVAREHVLRRAGKHGVADGIRAATRMRHDERLTEWIERLASTPAGKGWTVLAVAVVAGHVGNPVPANLRDDPILPTSLAMAAADSRHGRLGLFSPAAHAGPSGWLPGFERPVHGPALPLALYDLGGAADRSPTPSVALRLFVESVITVMEGDREAATQHPVALQGVTLRELLAWLYPGRKPKPNEYWPVLMRAMQALDDHDARFPWSDPVTGRGGLRRVVSLADIPRGPDALDDVVRLTVFLPPGSAAGPVIDRQRLRQWGVKSAPAYRAMLGIAYRWFTPGVTRIPANRRKTHWLQAQDPDRYEPLTNDEIIDLCYPTSRNSSRRDLLRNARRTLAKMERTGDLRIIDGRRLLPPARKNS